MNSQKMPRKSLLMYSMEGGVWLGLYLILCFACNVGAFYVAGLSIVALLLYVAVPYVLYRIILRYHRNSHIVNFFSVNWMIGVLLFIFASLISAIPEYVFYQYIDPQYLSAVVEDTLAQLDTLGWMQEDEAMAEVRKMSDEGTLPSTIQMTISQMWSKMFIGSLLSIVVSPFVVRKKKK